MTRARDIADQQDNLGGAVAPFVAGKNKFINGDFYWNQRNFTTTSTTLPTGYSDYGVDRWRTVVIGTTGAVTLTKNVFTPGTAPVAGYEAKNYFTIQTSGQSGTDILTLFRQSIEDVRVTAGNTYTISWWAKAASGTPSIAISVSQLFGSGGSPSANAEAPAGKVTIGTTWQRYSITYTIPSIAGKTLGTDENSSTRIQFFLSAGTVYATNSSSLGVQNNTFDLWGFQIEAGNVPTSFTTASGSIGGELALCQRYYQRYTVGVNQNTGFTTLNYSTTAAIATLPMKVTMRVAPTVLDYSNVLIYDSVNGFAITGLSLWAAGTTDTSGLLATGASGMTQFRAGILTANASGGYIGLSAEL